MTMTNVARLLLLMSIFWVGMDSYILVNVNYLDITIVTYLAQLIKILLFLAPAVIFYAKYGINKRALSVFFIYNLFLVVFVVFGLISGNDKTNIILSLKNIYLWIWYALLLNSINFKISTSFSRKIMFSFVVAILLNIVYSVYISLSFSGKLSDFYFYELYNNKGMFESWNFIRDGQVRAFGLVGSKLTLSQMAFIPGSFIMMAFIYNKDVLKKVFSLILGFVILYGLYITNTRNPLFAIALSTMVFLIFRRFKITGLRFLIVFIVVYLFSIYVVGYLSESGIGDESSQVRIPMIIDFLLQLQNRPIGYGIGSTGIANLTYKFFYESSAATIFMDLGVVGGALFWLGVLRVAFVSMKYGNDSQDVEMKIIYQTISFSLLCLLFITNFTNIFDFSLMWFSIIIVLATKIERT